VTVGFNGHFVLEFLKKIGAEGGARVSPKGFAAAVVAPETFNPEYQ
jgi:hypothetical protein